MSADEYKFSSIPVKQTKSTAYLQKKGSYPNETQSGGSKSTRCKALTRLLNILCVSFSFYLSRALVKAEREVLLELTNLTYISR